MASYRSMWSPSVAQLRDIARRTVARWIEILASTPITESIPTSVGGGERNRVSGQSPGESRGRSQNNHGLA